MCVGCTALITTEALYAKSQVLFVNVSACGTCFSYMRQILSSQDVGIEPMAFYARVQDLYHGATTTPHQNIVWNSHVYLFRLFRPYVYLFAIFWLF